MFPGFVHAYKDSDSIVHLFFYPGIDDTDDAIYRDLDMTNCDSEYTMNKYDDNSVEYIFAKKNIKKVSCNLIETKTRNVVKEIIKV